MKIVSFNINGIRARLHQLQELIARHRPDIIGLQETKVQDADFPLAAVQELGYRVEYFGQKSHYGVALLSRSAPLEVQKGFPGADDVEQRRLLAAAYRLADGGKLWVVNGYFPQGESRSHPVKFPAKERFYGELFDYLQRGFKPADRLVVMGDLNVAPGDLDIGIGDDNAKRWLRSGKCSFLPEERQWFERLCDWGLVDSYRQLFPQADDRFSWFDYRSRGFDREPKRGLRIDLILASPSLMEYCRDSGIDYTIRAMDRPSDHCPVWAEFELQVDGIVE